MAQGLYAINCYMGTRWGENNPEDHVRYARNDLMGMVREDLWFDMARHELFRCAGYRYDTVEARGIFLVMANAQCEYRYPAKFEDEVLIRVSVTKLGRKSLTCTYEIVHAKTARSLAAGSTTQVFIGQDGHGLDIPEDLRLLFHSSNQATVDDE